MNMILHDNLSRRYQGNTLTDPKTSEVAGSSSSTTWSPIRPSRINAGATGLDPLNDPFGRFESFGVPPNKQGDYAYCCISFVRSRAPAGVCVLPHGCCSVGMPKRTFAATCAKGYIKGIIGLPANLFYGTGIPACLIVIDKEHSHARKGIL